MFKRLKKNYSSDSSKFLNITCSTFLKILGSSQITFTIQKETKRWLVSTDTRSVLFTEMFI